MSILISRSLVRLQIVSLSIISDTFLNVYALSEISVKQLQFIIKDKVKYTFKLKLKYVIPAIKKLMPINPKFKYNYTLFHVS